MALTQNYQFNNQEYEISIRLQNTETDLAIPVGAVRDLIITDDIYAPFTTAVLIIDSTGNNLDNYIVDDVDELRQRLASRYYTFNMDARDVFRISFKPVGDMFSHDVWGFNYTYSIYDEEEVLEGESQLKSKIFYLREIREQYLLENKGQWSTSDVVLENHKNKINLSQVSNGARQAYTGDAIKHLITNSSLDYVPFAEDWDKGATKVFHTSNPQSSSYDDVEYILDRHVSSQDDDFCILGTERNGDMFLRPMSSFYKKAWREEIDGLGDYIIDAFSTHSGEVSNESSTTRVVPSKVYGFSAEESNALEGLVNFTYLNIANEDSLLDLVTTFVHSYNSGAKQFSIDCLNNHIIEIKDKMQDLYANKMKGKSVEALLPVNTAKVLNEVANHTFSTGGTKQERLHAGVNRVLKKAFTFTPGISFDVKGASSRRTGRFIIMNCNYINQESPFAKVFIGEWFTTKVVHYFSIQKQQYINTVTCVKPHTNKSLSNRDYNTVIRSYYDQVVDETIDDILQDEEFPPELFDLFNTTGSLSERR